MDYADNDVFRLRTRIRELEIEVDSLNSQNVRLANENAQMANDLNHKTKESNTASSINAELRLMLFKSENEQHELSSSLQSLKSKYNKLYDKYSATNQTFKAVNASFRLTPLEKPSVNIRSKFQRPATIIEPSVLEDTLELQKKLEESWDKIEELEFELESLEILEYQNESLRNELSEIKNSVELKSSPKQQYSKSIDLLRDPQLKRVSSSSRSSTSSGGENRFSPATQPDHPYDKNNNENIYEAINLGRQSLKPRSSMGGPVPNLIDEIQKFKFKNTSQGVNKE